MKALWHKALLDEFIRVQQVGKKHPILREKGFRERKVSLGYDCLKILLPILQGIVLERMTKHLSANEQAVIPGVPCPRHFKRLYDRYQEGGFDIIALVPDRRKAKQRASRFFPEDISIWLSVAKSYCNEKRPPCARASGFSSRSFTTSTPKRACLNGTIRFRAARPSRR